MLSREITSHARSYVLRTRVGATMTEAIYQIFNGGPVGDSSARFSVYLLIYKFEKRCA